MKLFRPLKLNSQSAFARERAQLGVVEQHLVEGDCLVGQQRV